MFHKVHECYNFFSNDIGVFLLLYEIHEASGCLEWQAPVAQLMMKSRNAVVSSRAEGVSTRSYTSDKIHLMSLAHSGSGERFYQQSG